MKTMTNTPQSIVNFKLLSFLFALTVVLHVVASAISIAHPLLSACLMLGESIGWFYIGLIWVIALTRSIQQWGPKTWNEVQTSVRTRLRATKVKRHDVSTSVKQLASLRDDVQRLGLALHGMKLEIIIVAFKLID